MADVIHMEEVRRAAEKLSKLLQNIHINQLLCTSEIIGLSFWLIDFENLESIQPVKRLFELLTDCLERQVIDREAYREIQVICSRYRPPTLDGASSATPVGCQEFRLR
jgi:hypothetical protein